MQVATVGFTFFDRDRAQLDALAVSLARRGRPVRVWSAGCSSGEEVWTLALALLQQGVTFSIHGSDVDTARLEVARRGCYAAERLQRLTDTERRAYFSSDGRGVCTVAEALREHVTFAVHNLADQPPPSGPFDAIVCRNVLMYFTPRATRAVMAGFRHVLSADGVALLAGHETPLDPAWVRRDDGDLLAWGPTDGAVPSARPRLLAAPLASDLTRRRARASGPPRSAVPSLPPLRLMAPTEAKVPPAPSAVHCLVQRACEGLAAHRWTEALDDFTAAIGLQPDWPEIHYLLGVLHRKTGDLESSRRALRRALYLEDQFWPAAWLLSGMLDAQAERGQLDRLRSGAIADAQVRPVAELFHVPDGAAWSPTVDQLMAHPHARRWRS